MSKKAAEHHKQSAEHHTHAARHHGEAAKHHEAGHHEKAAHHAHTARAHALHARHHSDEASQDSHGGPRQEVVIETCPINGLDWRPPQQAASFITHRLMSARGTFLTSRGGRMLSVVRRRSELDARPSDDAGDR